jgi:hypothetical protein
MEVINTHRRDRRANERIMVFRHDQGGRSSNHLLLDRAAKKPLASTPGFD